VLWAAWPFEPPGCASASPTDGGLIAVGPCIVPAARTLGIGTNRGRGTTPRASGLAERSTGSRPGRDQWPL
jgi:hypothetical protein